VSRPAEPSWPDDSGLGIGSLWPGLQIRHLAALTALAQEGSFGRAAERLGYTQSAISQQIAALERLVGQQLVERQGGTRPARLTPAGHLLEEHAEAILSRLSAARADLTRLPPAGRATLHLGTYQSVGACILPASLRRFTPDWPHVSILLTESNSDEDLLLLLERGQIDLSFAVLPLAEGPFEWVELMRDPYILIVPADSPLAERSEPVRAAELATLDLIGFRECRSVHAAEDQLMARGVLPRIVFRTNDNRTMHGLVAAGLGAALVPQLAYERRDEEIVALSLEADLLPPRIVALAWHRDRHLDPEIEGFIEVVRTCCATETLASNRPDYDS
jgi:DNA-binding transcriptional LysR family regulator